MIKNKNCPNCGAVISPKLNSCPYCGTSYFDLSAIDLNYRPFYLKIRYGDTIQTQKCIITSAEIEIFNVDSSTNLTVTFSTVE